MIGQQQIQEAIAYCQGKVDPNRNDAILLAACYILQDHISSPPTTDTTEKTTITQQAVSDAVVGDYGESEFLSAIRGKNPREMWLLMDDLMGVLSATNRRLYDGIIRKIEN